MPRSTPRRSVVAAVAGALVTSALVVPAASAPASAATSSTATATTSASTGLGARWVKKDRARLTKTPSSGSRTVGRPDDGTKLRVLERGRYRLKVQTPSGRVGWAAKGALTTVPLKDVSGTRYTKKAVVIRKGTGAGSRVVKHVRLGTTVKLLARTTGRDVNRVKVRLPGGLGGWVAANRLTTRDVWGKLARCESGGNPRTNTGNGFYGLYQFTGRTWHAVGGHGLPHRHGRAEQTKRAQILQDRAGWGQWPACTRKLGLR
ncbi:MULTISPECIES: transglycosylase family protein [unclassified Isoptericola]|uniref:transglycosylase family protein n=1 Tax=Isoptericola sp. NPDC057191 TaxID=3346041 RepID=UPI00364407BC